MMKQEDVDKQDVPVVGYWSLIVTIGLGAFMAAMDGSFINIALPTLARNLDSNLPTTQWIAIAYLLTLSVLMLGIGRLADMRGKKTLYITGSIIYAGAAPLSAAATTVYWLIATRVIQAVGAAMVLSLSLAIITEYVPDDRRGRAIGIIAAMQSAGFLAGPALGGIVLDVLSWRWMFLVVLPLGILVLLMAIRFIPDIKPTGGQKFDFAGALLFFVSILCFLLALTLGQTRGFGNWLVLVLIMASIVVLITFVIVERKTGQPIIDLSFFQKSNLRVQLALLMITSIAVAGLVILLPFILENVMAYTPRQVGLLLAINMLIVIIISPISGILSDRYGTSPVIIVALVSLVVGYGLFSTVRGQTTGIGFVIRLIPLGIGSGLFRAANATSIMSSVRQDQLGVTSGLLSITGSLGQTIGIALMGTLWASRVLIYTPSPLVEDALQAPIPAQTAGFRDAALFAMMMIGVGLIWVAIVEVKNYRQGHLGSGKLNG